MAMQLHLRGIDTRKGSLYEVVGVAGCIFFLRGCIIFIHIYVFQYFYCKFAFVKSMLLHQDKSSPWLSATSCKMPTANLDWDYMNNLTNKPNYKI